MENYAYYHWVLGSKAVVVALDSTICTSSMLTGGKASSLALMLQAKQTFGEVNSLKFDIGHLLLSYCYVFWPVNGSFTCLLLFKIFFFGFFHVFPLHMVKKIKNVQNVKQKYIKTPQEMILTSKQHAKHPFAG